VLAGSHVDAVRSGGDFDGPLGVLAAVEAAQTMREEGVETGRPVEVVAFTDEEGARFGLGMIGSRALAGLLTPDDLSREDENGVTVAEAMREVGLDPERIGETARGPGSVHAYVELHFEQGRVLEQRGLPVGVVTGIAGPVWLRFVLRGEAGHAGATPMHSLRHDALAAAAAVVGAVEREAERSGTSVGTVGRMEVEPGGVNVIPGRATFTVDLRDIDGPVINDDEVTGVVERTARETLGDDAVEIMSANMGGEDFSALQQAAPGTFFLVGAADEEEDVVYPHHHPCFAVDESALPVGVRMFVRAAFELLGRFLPGSEESGRAKYGFRAVLERPGLIFYQV